VGANRIHESLRHCGRVDLDEAYDVIEDLQFSLSGDDLIEALSEHAEALARGEEGRAAFLNVRGEFLAMADRFDEARTAYREALDDGGPTVPHPQVGLLSVALATGDEQAQTEIHDALLRLSRADALDEASYEAIGETLELADHPRQALRWYNLALRGLDPDDIEALPIGVLNGRGRVRSKLGLPPDRYDEAAPLVRDNFRL
jgi:tetratricopeptide (TPR) repeat protein